MYPEHTWFFLDSGLLGTTNLQIPRVYYTIFSLLGIC
jgi:hypothetical protein